MTLSKQEKIRCFGGKPGQTLYADYHDNEWGVPLHDDRKLFEMLILEGAQAGLTWETVLKRRLGYREVFYQFDIEKVAHLQPDELEQILLNPKIIRNRLKVYSTQKNAEIFIKIQKEFGSFDHYIWKFVNYQPLLNQWRKFSDIPSKTPLSDQISKDLKKRGMTFVGSTIVYAYMQAIGLVNDHIMDCFCHPRFE